MSYSFNVKKIDGALVVQCHDGMVAHIPDGASFMVNGHEPSQYGPIGSLSVALSIVGGEGEPSQYRATAAVSYNAPPAATVELAETVSVASGAVTATQID